MPVNKVQLQQLIDKTLTLKSSWPVATSTSAQARFEVSDNNFQRRLVLSQDQQILANIYVGTSPGFRQSHIRIAEDKAIYKANINSYELSTKADDWLDKTLLSAKDINAINGPGYQLTKQDQQWQLKSTGDQAAESQATNHEQANKLVKALAELRVLAISDKAIDKANTSLTVSNQQQQWQYQFAEQDGDYLVSRDDWGQVFSLSKKAYEEITKLDAPALAVQTQDKDNNVEKENNS